MTNLTFRSSRIIYYGPHACEHCGESICRMGHEFGGNAFTYPSGLIYPNTEWHPHVCDPKRVAALPGDGRAVAPSEAVPMSAIGIKDSTGTYCSLVVNGVEAGQVRLQFKNKEFAGII